MTATAAPDDAHPIQLKPGNVDNVAGNWVTNAMLLQWAIAYATHGTPVFPCCPWDGAYNDYKGNSIKAKAPLVAHGFKDATTDVNQIGRWWETLFPFAMIGRMVPADQVCSDIDPWKGGKLSDLQAIVGFPLGREPATQSTWSGRNDGGTHLFFQRPLGPLVSTKLPKGIDLRVGGNHYTIIAPSIHPETGGAYAWMWDNQAPVQPCPPELADLLVQPERTKTERVWKTGEAAGYMDTPGGPLTRGQISGILRKVGTAPNGDRNNILHWGACRFFEHQQPPEAIADLADAGLDCGLPKSEIQNTIDSASLRYKGVKHAKLW
jgi:hypothetical protein